MAFIFFVFLILAILLQTNIFPSLLHTNIKPDIFLSLTIYASLFFESSRGIVYGFISGMLLDIFSGGAIGSNTFSLMIVGLLAENIKNFVLLENIPAQALLVTASTLFQWTIAFIYRGTLQLTLDSILGITYFLSAQVLLNLVSAFILFFLLDSLKQKQSLRI